MKINILEYLRDTAEAKPDRIALVDGDRSLTFIELLSVSNALSEEIQNLSCSSINRPIAVYIKKSIECVASDIAVLMSGNAYMNLDTGTPVNRISAILEQTRPIAILTDSQSEAAISESGLNIPIIKVNLEELHAKQESIFNFDIIPQTIIDTDPMCIINTSGSTGTPKSVVLNHRSFIDFTEWAIATTGIGKDEIVGSLSPVVFDIYSFELCMLMSLGSRLVLIKESLSAFPARIMEILNTNKITYIFWVPTIMVNIANMGLLERISLPSLNNIWFAGEVFPTKQFNVWRANIPNARYINLYGPIEITLDCTYYIVDRPLHDDEPIPIGYPCRNTDILILDENDELAADGSDGELCVRGTSLAMGYYNDPEKTSKAFVQNPLNKAYPEIIYRTGDIVSKNTRGEIMFKGRKDTLIKHSGYRIELSEIEHIVINNLQLVGNGVAIYNHGKKEIVFIYEHDYEYPIAEFRKKLLTSIPKYMVPTSLIKLDELPRNANGKIDRLKLTELL